MRSTKLEGVSLQTLHPVFVFCLLVASLFNAELEKEEDIKWRNWMQSCQKTIYQCYTDNETLLIPRLLTLYFFTSIIKGEFLPGREQDACTIEYYKVHSF